MKDRRFVDLRKVTAAVVVAAAGYVMAPLTVAALTDMPTAQVKGRTCYYYDVQPGESIYGVSEKLGITREDILRHNQSAADGLKPKMRLFFPVDEFNKTGATAKAPRGTTHLVKKGETLYGIARRYGMSPDDLAKLNPDVADGLRAGDILTITASSANSISGASADPVTVDGEGFAIYEIKPGDTLFSIANRYNISLEVLLDANQSVDPLHYNAGQTLRIPIGVSVREVASVEPEAMSAQEPEYENDRLELLAGNDEPSADSEADDSVEEETASTAVQLAEEEPMNVAVMLPFMLKEEQQSRTTQLYTEFYKGMLMAADTLRTATGAPVKFRFYDTAASIDTVRAILARPEMAEIDLLVAPDNAAQLALIMDTVDDETLVLNIFAVKDESYKNYRNLIQTNIPHDDMYAKAIDMFVRKYDGVMPVFLSRTGGHADKESFTTALKKRLDAEGRVYREITFNTYLADTDVAQLNVNEQPVVFVPNSGSKTEFAKFVQALTSLRQSADSPSNITIFGYPEWVTFRGESFDEICALDATIYSRYLATEQNRSANSLKERYKQWYGVEMFEAVPTQGILGFDTGVFVINGLKQLASTGVFPSEYDGVQGNMRLMWSGDSHTDASGELVTSGGLVNEALYFINYRPGGIVGWEN